MKKEQHNYSISKKLSSLNLLRTFESAGRDLPLPIRIGHRYIDTLL
jgi:hypothetical protein